MPPDTGPDKPSPEEQADQLQLAKLTELLLRPLGEDEEMRGIFLGDMQTRSVGHWLYDPGDMRREEAISWLAARPIKVRRRPRLLPWLIPALVLTLLAMGLEIYNIMPAFAFKSGAPAALRHAGESQVYRLPPRRADNPLLDKSSDLEAAQAAWHAHPDDPAMYYYYTSTLKARSTPLPADYEATWRRVDPDNAFWLLQQARRDGDSYGMVFDPATGTVRKALPGEGRGQEDLNSPGVAATMDLLEQASRLPRCQSYRGETQRYLRSMLTLPPTTLPQALVCLGSIDAGAPAMAAEISNWQALAATLSLRGQTGQGEKQVKGWINSLQQEALDAQAVYESPAIQQAENRAENFIGLRAGAVIVAAISCLITVALAFRLLPVRSAATRLALCASQLLDPRDSWLQMGLCVALPALLTGGFASALFLSHTPLLRRSGDSIMVAILIPALFLATLAITTVRMRRENTARVALLSLRSAHNQPRISLRLQALSLTPVTCVAAVFGSGAAKNEVVAVLMAGMVLAGWFIAGVLLGPRYLLGYTSAAANIRHRIHALRLFPVAAASSIAFAFIALTLHVEERAVVKESMWPALTMR